MALNIGPSSVTVLSRRTVGLYSAGLKGTSRTVRWVTGVTAVPNGLYWTLPDSTNTCHNLPDYTSLYQILPDSARSYQILPVFFSYFHTLPHTTRLYQDPTILSWILSDFTRSYRTLPNYYETLSDTTRSSQILILNQHKTMVKKVYFFNDFMIDNFQMFPNFQEFEDFPENSKLRSIVVSSASASN